MIVSLRHFLGWLLSVFRSREDLVLENLALRRQLLALHAQQPRRRLTALHKLFWVALRTFWSGWTKPLILVTPSGSLIMGLALPHLERLALGAGHRRARNGRVAAWHLCLPRTPSVSTRILVAR
jgi:hypothetical protein